MAPSPLRLNTIPMGKMLSKVPATANVTTSGRFDRNSELYRVNAESRMTGGRRMLKNRLCENVGKTVVEAPPLFSKRYMKPPIAMPRTIRAADSGKY